MIQSPDNILLKSTFELVNGQIHTCFQFAKPESKDLLKINMMATRLSNLKDTEFISKDEWAKTLMER